MNGGILPRACSYCSKELAVISLQETRVPIPVHVHVPDSGSNIRNATLAIAVKAQPWKPAEGN